MSYATIDPRADPRADARAGPRAAAVAVAPTRAQVADAIGQRIVTAIDAATPSKRLLRRVRAGRIGGVILFSRNITSVRQVRRAVDRLQAAARDGGNPPLMVMVDQEGGPVKRFSTLPPTRAPRAMTTTQIAHAEGAATGNALRAAGITIDLAPVADVTRDRRSFLYERTAPGPQQTCAFAAGLLSAGVTPTLKHWPGLGGAPRNTDDAPVTLKTGIATIRRRAAAYRQCGAAGLIMVASARYSAIGAGRPALIEPQTYALLHTGQGVASLTISDSLQAKALRATPHVAIRAIQAGLDVLLSTGSEQTAQELYDGLRDAVGRKYLSAVTVVAGADRIRAFKARR